MGWQEAPWRLFGGGGPAVAGLGPLLSCSVDQEDAGGAGSNAILGQGPDA